MLLDYVCFWIAMVLDKKLTKLGQIQRENLFLKIAMFLEQKIDKIETDSKLKFSLLLFDQMSFRSTVGSRHLSTIRSSHANVLENMLFNNRNQARYCLNFSF